MTASGAGGRSWPLRGAWRVWLWGSVLVAVVLALAGVGVVVLVITVAVAGHAPGVLVMVLVGVLPLGIAAAMGWQLRHLATTVTVADDGALAVRLLPGALHTHCRRVRRVQPSALASPPHTPTVVETDDGWFYLVRSRQEKEDILDAVRRAHPGLRIHL